MKILFVEWKSAGQDDLKAAFLAEGHKLVYFSLFFVEGCPASETEDNLLLSLRREVPDLVFSVDFFPVISRVCNKERVRYLSWTYDSPYREFYSGTIVNPCNVACVFDSALYQEFHNAGISTVYYMPLAADAERLDSMKECQRMPLSYDISFVGSLYVEGGNNHIDRIMPMLSERTKGYLSGLINVQMKIQGYDFIEELLTPVIDELWGLLPVQIQPNGIESREFLWAQYIINRRITALERLNLLEAVADRHQVDLFTWGRDFTMNNVRNHGPVDYYSEMPWVFKRSRINLNISLRGIRRGIPLRAFDIMGSGGFLLSNYQSDFLDFFVPGEDFVYYESEEDLLHKIDYYLGHEKERQEIARNGHDKVAAGHTYRHRVREMLFLCEKSV